MSATNIPENNPLSSLDVWEDDLLQRYPDPETIAKEKTTEEYRNYEAPARDSVREFYRQNHLHQTYDFVQTKRKEFLALNRNASAHTVRAYESDLTQFLEHAAARESE